MSELKPCPFCGEDERIGIYADDVAVCNTCWSESPLAGSAQGWSTRPTEDRLRRERDEARRALEEIRTTISPVDEIDVCDWKLMASTLRDVDRIARAALNREGE